MASKFAIACRTSAPLFANSMKYGNVEARWAPNFQQCESIKNDYQTSSSVHMKEERSISYQVIIHRHLFIIDALIEL